MTLDNIKTINNKKDFNGINLGKKFLLHNELVAYVGDRLQSCCAGKHKWTNPVVISIAPENKEVFKEMEIHGVNYQETQIIDKKNPLYNLYNQLWRETIN